MSCIWNEPFRQCPRQNRGPKQEVEETTCHHKAAVGWRSSKVQETPQGKVQTGATEPTPRPSATSLAVTNYKGVRNQQCESGLFGITMNPENYAGLQEALLPEGWLPNQDSGGWLS